MADRLYNYYKIEKAIGYLTENFSQQPDLHEVAEKVFMSPFHFQKVFTDWVGISPKKFLQYLTIDHLRNKIAETNNMMEAAVQAGLSSQSRVHELFVKIEGMSPQQYKSGGKGLHIVYGYHPTPFGLCFIAVAEKGICALKFIDEEQSRNEFELFEQKWPFASLEHKPSITKDYVKKIFNRHPGEAENLQVLVQGSPFQLKVWKP